MLNQWRELSRNNGVVTYFRHTADGKIEYNTVEDTQPLLDMAKKAKNNESGNWKGDLHHVASIPITLYMEWAKEFGGNPMSPENKPKLMRKLQERQFSALRVKSGRLV